MIGVLENNLLPILRDLRPYDRPQSIQKVRKTYIRNLWYDLANPTDPIQGRSDLCTDFPIRNPGWQRDLTAFIIMMSEIHDQATAPAAILVKHIIDQFHKPLDGEFLASQAGIGEAIAYISFAETAPIITRPPVPAAI